MDGAVPRAMREMPTAALADYRRFHRRLEAAVDEHGIVLEPAVRNAIRNAWRDGYWSGRETSAT